MLFKEWNFSHARYLDPKLLPLIICIAHIANIFSLTFVIIHWIVRRFCAALVNWL